MYWWSVPALLKGWIDRVFVNGWAFEYAATGGVLPKLQRLTTHLLPIAGADAGAYERHGYEMALRTQLTHGLIDYVGSQRGATAFVHDSEQPSTGAAVDHAVRTLASAVGAPVSRS